MKVLYIGQYTYGTTSRLRGEVIKNYKLTSEFFLIDTNIPYLNSNKILRTIGFRYKIGPLISSINQYILDNLPERKFDIIWIDKGMFITPRTLKILRAKAYKLIHYTPDTAFHQNKSRLFEKSISKYNHLITTKSFEKENYLKLIDKEKLIFTTQGYSSTIHKPYHTFEQKDNSVIFIGLAEKSREVLIEQLLSSGINVKLAGFGWHIFVQKNSSPQLNYLGEKLVGEEYAKAISSSLFGVGALSKRFPELHTTRTFEIPACGTALLTESNTETATFFSDRDVIFYKNHNELIDKIKYYQHNVSDLNKIINKGKAAVVTFSYDNIITGLLHKILK